MNRRKYLASTALALAGLAGCPGGDSGLEPTTGVVFDREISNLREQFEEVQAGQHVVVEVSNVGEGEMLLFRVGDGTGFVHTDRFYVDRTGGYTFESDGRHQLLFSPKRDEVPMNEDVTISVTARIESG